MKRILRALLVCVMCIAMVSGLCVNSFAATSAPKVKKQTQRTYMYNDKRDAYELTSKTVIKNTYKSGNLTKLLEYSYSYVMKKVDGKWKPVCTTKNALSNHLTFTYDSKNRIKTRTSHFYGNDTVTKFSYKTIDGKKYVTSTYGNSKTKEVYNSKKKLIYVYNRTDGKLTGKLTYRYNSKGDMTKQIQEDFYADTKVTSTFKNYYNSKGVRYKVVEKMDPVYNWSKTTTYYHTSGKAKGLESEEVITLLSGGEAYNYTTYKFDSKGRMIRKTWKNSRTKQVTLYEY